MAKQKVKIRNQYNYEIQPGVKIPGESQTIPGEAFTIPELFERLASGQVEEIVKDNYGYPLEDPDHDDPDFDKVLQMDLVDQQEAVDTQILRDVDNKKRKLNEESANSDSEAKQNKSEEAEQSDENNKERFEQDNE